MALKLGADFRSRMQEEAQKRNTRCNGDFVESSDAFGRFCEEALALSNEGRMRGVVNDDPKQMVLAEWPNYRRIPGKHPQVTLEDVSLRDLAAQTVVDRRTGEPVGELFIEQLMNPGRTSNEHYTRFRTRFLETGEVSAVDWSMFTGITGPFLFNEVMRGFEHEQFVFTKMCGTYPTQYIAGERYPGVSQPIQGDVLGLDRAQLATSPTAAQGMEDLLLKRPGKEFARATMGENYLDLPETQLRGLILDVDRTAIYTDRTALIASNAQNVGETLGKHKELRGLRLLCGLDTQTQYKEKYAWDTNGSINLDVWQSAAAANGGSYQLSSVAPTRKFPFINDVPSNPLDTWETFKESDFYFQQIVDPNDGWPLTITSQDIFAPWSQRFDIPRITQAYQVYMVAQGLATGSAFGNGSIMTASPNPVNTLGKINPQCSRLLSQVMLMAPGTYAAGGTGGKKDPEHIWFTGDFKKAFKYMENWPIKVIQRPPLSEAEFLQDVVLGYRADERGRWYPFDPRVVQRNNYVSQTAPTNPVTGE